MNPPFDPPYLSIQQTEEGVRRIETLADGSTRPLAMQDSSKCGKPLRASNHLAVTAKVPPPDNSSAAIFLNVPFAEKEEAKKLGAKWDAAKKQWYVPLGKDVNQFVQWWPDVLKDVMK
jgi:hypothetical protein